VAFCVSSALHSCHGDRISPTPSPDE
jgi:hypothetical protein